MDCIQKEIKDKYGVYVVRSGDRFLEILPDNISKGHALSEVIDLFNLDTIQIIMPVLLGDYYQEVVEVVTQIILI